MAHCIGADPLVGELRILWITWRAYSPLELWFLYDNFQCNCNINKNIEPTQGQFSSLRRIIIFVAKLKV